MRIIADLHIHSKYARATGKDLDLINLEKYSRIKGVNLLGSGDFTHPKWIAELKSSLAGRDGIYYSKSGFPFILQTEISLVYTQGGKGRRVHHLIYAPSFEVVDQINSFLLSKGRLDYDGRPIFGLSSVELLEKLHEISSDIELIPAHAWTPWFGVLGASSGFNSLKDCFLDKTHLIHSIETGMSSDPAMNHRVPFLDNISLISNSDCHSYWPWRLGREANVFDFDKLSYKNIVSAIRERKGFIGTVEVDPGYGKYHFSGHSVCKVSLSPSESKSISGICPVCKKRLTIGVLERVEELSTRPEGFVLKGSVPFKTLIPLSEIISLFSKKGIATKEVWGIYNSLIAQFGDEFNVLLFASKDDLLSVVSPILTDLIIKNREGLISVIPGFDGEYGKPIFGDLKNSKVNKSSLRSQTGLSDFI